MSSNLRFISTIHYDTSHSRPYSSSHDRIPRRRKRPSNRTRERKPLSRYDDYSDSIDIALDTGIRIPNCVPNSASAIKNSPPTPMMRKSFDQSWLRWKEREVRREKEERDATALRNCEMRRVFGGEGEDNDDVDLCPKMLEVVMFLFGGDIDFGYLDSGD